MLLETYSDMCASREPPNGWLSFYTNADTSRSFIFLPFSFVMVEFSKRIGVNHDCLIRELAKVALVFGTIQQPLTF